MRWNYDTKTQRHNSVAVNKDFEVGSPEASGVIVESKNQRDIIVLIHVPSRVEKFEFFRDSDKVLERLAS